MLVRRWGLGELGRRSKRIFSSKTEAGSTSGLEERQSAVKAPRKAAASTDWRNWSNSAGIVDNDSLTRAVLAFSDSIPLLSLSGFSYY